MPRLFIALGLCGLLAAAGSFGGQMSANAQSLPGADQLKPLPAPHNDLPPIPAPPGAVFPSAKPAMPADKPVPEDREALLSELYSHLAQAPSEADAAPIEKAIEGVWQQSGSDTVGVLMSRAAKAFNDKDDELALQFLDAVVELMPDYAEGWNRRAVVQFRLDNYEAAVGDLRRALALDPHHYKALDGLARILRDTGQKKAALKAYREILKINPHQSGAKEAIDELSVEVEGQGI